MKPGSVGTAEGIALYRHMLAGDPYAGRFLGARGPKREQGWRRAAGLGLSPDALFARTPSAAVARGAHIDGLLQAAVSEGAGQLVLLGAGFDTRPWRLPVGDARWFLVDHPRSAQLREERAGDLAPVGARVDVDFTAAPLAPALEGAGFDPSAPSVWIAEGLSPYLSADDNAAWLRAVAALAAPGSTLLMDIWLRQPTGGLFGRLLVQTMTRFAGEPILWPTALPEAEALLREAGWTLASACASNAVPGFSDAYAGMVSVRATRAG